MRRTGELQRKTPLRARRGLTSRTPLPRVTPLKVRSDKRAVAERQYARLRREFLAAHPRCTFPAGCIQAATEIHHRAGRVGALYLDVTRWSGLCHDHHGWVTGNPAAAIQLGISDPRVAALDVGGGMTPVHRSATQTGQGHRPRIGSGCVPTRPPPQENLKTVDR